MSAGGQTLIGILITNQMKTGTRAFAPGSYTIVVQDIELINRFFGNSQKIILKKG